MSISLKWEEASTDSGFGSDLDSEKLKLNYHLKTEESNRKHRSPTNNKSPPCCIKEDDILWWDNLKLGDIEHVKVLGGGGFARVDLVQLLRNNRMEYFALKKINTKFLVDNNQIKQLNAEKQILSMSQSRFIPRLYRNFMGNNHEYLLTEACLGGDMFTYLEEKGPMQCKSAMFVIACVISALDYLHNVLRCLHRDVKTENLLIGYAGMVKLGDLGFCKFLDTPESSSNSFCGTPGYIAPEIILNKSYSCKVDYFSLGVVAFELMTCRSPFRRQTTIDTYKSTLRGITDVAFPSLLDHLTQAFIRNLCCWDPEQRIGSEGKSHDWFHGFEWEKLKTGKMISPLQITPS